MTPDAYMEAEIELGITEQALALLSQEIKIKDRFGSSGLIYECAVCGKKDVWTSDWRWFGSYRELEECGDVLKACSRECFEYLCRLEIMNVPKKRNRHCVAAY